MNDAKRRFILTGFKVLDICQLTMSFGLAILFVVHQERSVGLMQFLSLRVKVSNFAVFGSILLLWHATFSSCGMYKSKRLSARSGELMDVFWAGMLSTVLLAVVGSLTKIRMITPLFLLYFWFMSTLLLVSSRLILRPVLAALRKRGRNLRYLLVLGTNPRAINFARRIGKQPELGYRLLGFVDDDWAGMAQFKEARFPLVSNFAGLPEFLRSHVVDEVAMYLPLRSFYQDASTAATLCEQHGIVVRFDGDIFGLKKSRSGPDELGDDHYLTTYTGVRDWGPLAVKRILDVLISLVLLLLCAPLFVAVAALIRFSSGAPVFFRQERMGLNKRKFLIFKFRTMVPNAENMLVELRERNEVSGPVFKMRQDPRITPIGGFLRRTSIDELPQLLNVLIGDMSLVGPRPLPIRDYEGFSEDWQRRRFSVRPGITCIWQVNGRSSVPFEQWMKMDLQYMDEWSLWLDMKILVRTVSAVLKGSGAA